MATDARAGLTVGVLLVPQSLAYAALAGLPPVTGLYTGLGAVLAYGVLGTSPYVSPGPSAVTALLIASALAPFAAGSAAQLVGVAGVLALMVAAARALLGGLRLGRLVSLASQPVLTGFTAAAGIVIAFSQVPALLGIQATGAAQPLVALGRLVDAAQTVNPATALLGVALLAGLVLLRRVRPRAPGPLLALAIAITVTALAGLADHGVALVAPIPSRLPAPALVWPGWQGLQQLLPSAVIIALVGYVEGMSIGKTLAARDRQVLDPDRELVAHAGAAGLAGLLGGFPAGGSFSRTALAAQAGATSPAAALAQGGCIVVALVALPEVLSRVPEAALAAVVLSAVTGLFDGAAARQAARVSRRDRVALVATFAATLALGIEIGFLAGATINLVIYLYRNTGGRVTELASSHEAGGYRDVRRWSDARPEPWVAVLRIDGPLTFLNADAIQDRLGRTVASRPDLEALVVDCSAVPRVDATGVQVFTSLLHQAAEHVVEVRLVAIRGPVRDALITVGWWDQAAPLVHRTVAQAIASLPRDLGPAVREFPQAR